MSGGKLPDPSKSGTQASRFTKTSKTRAQTDYDHVYSLSVVTEWRKTALVAATLAAGATLLCALPGVVPACNESLASAASTIGSYLPSGASGWLSSAGDRISPHLPSAADTTSTCRKLGVGGLFGAAYAIGGLASVLGTRGLTAEVKVKWETSEAEAAHERAGNQNTVGVWEPKNPFTLEV